MLAVNEAELLAIQEKQLRTEEELLMLQTHEQNKLDIYYANEEAKAQLINNAGERQLALDKVRKQKELAQLQLKNKQENDLNKNQIANDKATKTAMLDTASNFLQAGLMLSKQGSNEAKAMAITQATINGYRSFTEVMGSPTVPPLMKPALASSYLAITLAQVAKIASQKYAMGGIVGGNSMSGDRVPALVNSGEMILNRQQQTQLFNDINNGGNNTGMIREIIAEIKSIPIIVQANGREIARLIRDEKNAGFAF
jgi:hypothetical protein